MALFVDLAALSNGLHGSVQMDSVALFLWIGWLRHHGILSRYKKTVETPSLVAVEVNDDIGSANTGCISFKLNGMSFEFDESAPDNNIQRIIKICLAL